MSAFQSAWSFSGPVSTDSTSTLISQFPIPPTNMMQQYQQQSQSLCMETPIAYTAPAVISLGEEYTDDTLPQAQTSYLSMDDEEEGFDYDEDEDSDDGDYSPIYSDGPSPSAMNGQSTIPALWHAEHARLLHIQTAVLDNEREARSRELKLESEVARIKDDLAKLKEARAQTFIPSFSSAQPSSSTKAATSPTTSQAPPQQRACGPRGPRPRPQQSQRASTLVKASSSSGSRQISSSAVTTIQEQAQCSSTELSPPSLGKFSFEEDDETTETVLSNHLTEARSARAQERQKRKKEYERIRELSMLLTLGSEVRKWEERLAWQQARAVAPTPSSDDMSIESSTKSSNKDMDTDPDPRGKRLSRSFSLPSRGSYNPTAAPSPSTANRTGPPSPALPSLALSPLWRVSAEMILRRRSLSERPRRVPPKRLLPQTANPAEQPEQQQSQSTVTSPNSLKPGSGPLPRPAHTLRGPREQRSGNSVSSDLALTNTTSSITDSALRQNVTGVSSACSTPSSGKRYSIPPPITIPSNSQFCKSMAATLATSTGAQLRMAGQTPSANMSNSATFILSKTTPIRPSALKWAFTADDLARERELEAMSQREKADQSDSASSSSESESDDSGKSSSSSSSSGPEASQTVERRGRARFSWRRSIPKDSNNTATATTTPQTTVDV